MRKPRAAVRERLGLASAIVLVLLLAISAPAAGPARALDPAEVTADARPLFKVEDPRLGEASGIGVGPDDSSFFMVQDAGKPPEVFVVDRTGRTRATVKLPFPNEDWEDVATGLDEQGRPSLFVADTGDAFFTRRAQALGPRTRYAVLQVVQPGATTGSSNASPAEDPKRYPFVFADGGNHNAETLLVPPGTRRFYVLDKTEVGRNQVPHLWVGPDRPLTDKVNTFTRVAQVGVQAASGGAFSPGGERFEVRDGQRAYLWWVERGDVAAALQTRPLEIPLPAQRQGEGVAFTSAGDALLVNSEGAGSIVWEVPLPSEAKPASAAADVPDALASGSQHSGRPLLVAVAAAVGLVLLLAEHQRRSRRRRHGPS